MGTATRHPPFPVELNLTVNALGPLRARGVLCVRRVRSGARHPRGNIVTGTALTDATAVAAVSTTEAIVDSTTDAAADSAVIIDTLRGQIDALDTAISRLVAERAQLSRRIQAARMNAGGTRIELGRERAIIEHYRTTLGTDGAAVGEAVLRACRGAR